VPVAVGFPLDDDQHATSTGGARMIKSLIFMVLFFLIATFPATWLTMLFLGNVGPNVSYWGALPLGILLSVLLAGVSTPRMTVIKS
jgi:hypothetical protein